MPVASTFRHSSQAPYHSGQCRRIQLTRLRAAGIRSQAPDGTLPSVTRAIWFAIFRPGDFFPFSRYERYEAVIPRSPAASSCFRFSDERHSERSRAPVATETISLSISVT